MYIYIYIYMQNYAEMLGVEHCSDCWAAATGYAMWKCGQAKCSPVTLRMFLRCVHHMRKLVHTLDLRRSMCTIPWNPPCPCLFGNPVVTLVR